MQFLMDYSQLISLFSALGAILFGVGLLRFPNLGKIHFLLALNLSLFGVTTFFRVFHWQTHWPFWNQLAYLGLSLLPLTMALFVEKAANQRFSSYQKAFYLLGAISFFLGSLNSSLLSWRPFLVCLLVFHLIGTLFYISILKKGKKASKNIKEKNIMVCLEISFYAIFFLAISDWLYKLGYLDFHLFPVGVSIFVYYLSMIIYSLGTMRWAKQSLKLLLLIGLSLFVSFISHQILGWQNSQFLPLTLALFTFLINVYSIYNQSNPRANVDDQLWENYDERLSLNDYLNQVNKLPEFHGLSLLKEEYIKKQGCYEFLSQELQESSLLSREKIQEKLEKTKFDDPKISFYQSLVYLFSVTDSDYFIRIPHSKDFLCVKFIKIINPDLHKASLYSLSQKIALLQMNEKKDVG